MNYMAPIFVLRDPTGGIVIDIYLRIVATGGVLGTAVLSTPKLVTFFGKHYNNFRLRRFIRNRRNEMKRNAFCLRTADKDLSRTRQYSGRLSFNDAYEEKAREMFKRLTLKIHEDPNQLINVPDAFKVSREHSQQRMPPDPGQSQSVPNEIKELETHQ